MLYIRLAIILTTSTLLMGGESIALAIDAVRGKEYHLSEQHGPWMIMAATFSEVPKERKQPGLTPEEAAQELVIELRNQGIPAYTYRQESIVDRIRTTDRLGAPDDRVYKAQNGMISVLAGNYDKIDDPTGQKTLNHIKKFFPKFLKDSSNGGVYRLASNQKGPLHGAFLTINPLIRPEEIARRNKDDLIIKLNSGIDNSITECKGKYTVRVASFLGKKVPISTKLSSKEEEIRDRIGKDPKHLNQNGEDAAQLARVLRQQGHEAYVYHDHFDSYVTLGSFQEENDPRAQAIFTRCSAKPMKDDKKGDIFYTPEMVKLQEPGKDKLIKSWMLDATPRMIKVPRIK